MPQKTKKEKIIAQLRRKLINIPQTQKVPTITDQNRSVSLSTFTLPPSYAQPTPVYTPTKVISRVAKNSTTDLSSMYHDLKKITVVTGLAITFEAMVYWFIENQTVFTTKFF